MTELAKMLYHLLLSADARQALLDAIDAKKGDEEVISALRELAKENKTSSPAKSEKIFGEWNLLWASENAEARPQLAQHDCRTAAIYVLLCLLGLSGRSPRLC